MTETLMRQVGQAWSRCAQSCGQVEGAPPCAEDELCHEGLCRLRCSLDRPYPCMAQFCVSTDSEGHGVCLSSPESWHSDTGWPRH
ncbi:hypothetical protein [Cystobacter fuscus]|uniref:hypothetical protein n=1 Tax=Cystobacter fuscus TaxID=43 RepID=UPI0037BECDB0